MIPDQNHQIQNLDKKLRCLVFFGLLSVFVILGAVAAWASLSVINGAVIAAGRLVVESDLKRVQHLEGGTVKDILVVNGDVVKKGDSLIHLDTFQLDTELNVISQEYLEWIAKVARLTAERDELRAVIFPDELTDTTDPLASSLIAIQKKQFLAQRAANGSRLGQLRKRIDQLRQEITGLKAQKVSNNKQLSLAAEELSVSRDLLDKGLTKRQNVLSVEREAAKLQGSDGQLIAQIARAEGKISETELQIIQLTDDSRTKILEELREAESNTRKLFERRAALTEMRARATISAPWSGVVHDMSIFNPGAVISPGQAIMAIVPTDDKLLVEAEVRPQDIDQVNIGQEVDLVFENANNRITPRIAGKIKWVSAYINSTNGQEAPPFYTTRIEVDNETLTQLNGLELKPGMPVSAFIKTESRTPLSYLIKPASEMWERVFREK